MAEINEMKYDRQPARAGEIMTLEQFIIEQERCLPHRRGAFSRVIRDIGLAAKIVNRDINRAGLVEILGEAGSINVQGEAQQKLDVMAHDELVRALQRGGVCCLIGSEEQEGIIVLKPVNGVRGDYAVLFDPLDGSSNIDVNVSVGTIFSIYRVPDSITTPVLEDALRPGVEQVAAGYVIYGSSTMFVYTTGNGVNGFTLDPSIGEFFLSHPNIRIPEQGNIYSINEGYYNAFEPGLKKYIKWLQAPDSATKRPYTTRYIGSYISDFHRNLLKGGIYMYPATAKNPNGKLRLMYEVNPTAFIVEQAGGLATDGRRRVLEKKPATLHERIPLYIGSKAMVEMAQEFLANE